MLHLPPTNLISQPLKKTTKNKGNTKSLSRKKSVKKFLESRQETGPKAKKQEDRMSNWTRQNNKRTDRKMESNDSSEIPDREGGEGEGGGGETSEEPRLP